MQRLLHPAAFSAFPAEKPFGQRFFNNPLRLS
jgi:hypothetical protein